MGVTNPFPSPDAIARAELLTRERFVYEGESIEEALAPGSARRRALDAAVEEVAAGNSVPSIEWRREFSLLLGLERLLSEEEPSLVDGTVLSAHQVDALSGTLTALLADAQRISNGNGAANGASATNGNGNGERRLHARQTARPRAPPRRKRNGAAQDDAELDADDEAQDWPEADEEDEPQFDEEPQDWQDPDDGDSQYRGAARGSQRAQALLVRARDRRR